MRILLLLLPLPLENHNIVSVWHILQFSFYLGFIFAARKFAYCILPSRIQLSKLPTPNPKIARVALLFSYLHPAFLCFFKKHILPFSLLFFPSLFSFASLFANTRVARLAYFVANTQPGTIEITFVHSNIS